MFTKTSCLLPLDLFRKNRIFMNFQRFVCLFYSFCFVGLVVLSGEPRQNQGRGLVDRKLVQAPIAGRPKAALLF